MPNTVVQQLLGRLPPGALATGNTTVALLDTDHRLYGPRRNQIDMRFAKIVRFGTTRTNVGVDLGNLLNSNYATTYQSQYDYVQPNGGSWLNPTHDPAAAVRAVQLDVQLLSARSSSVLDERVSKDGQTASSASKPLHVSPQNCTRARHVWLPDLR